jgi:hypothetical protein
MTTSLGAFPNARHHGAIRRSVQNPCLHRGRNFGDQPAIKFGCIVGAMPVVAGSLVMLCIGVPWV